MQNQAVIVLRSELKASQKAAADTDGRSILLSAESDQARAALSTARATDAENYARCTQILEGRLAETQANMGSEHEEFRTIVNK